MEWLTYLLFRKIVLSNDNCLEYITVEVIVLYIVEIQLASCNTANFTEHTRDDIW